MNTPVISSVASVLAGTWAVISAEVGKHLVVTLKRDGADDPHRVKVLMKADAPAPAIGTVLVNPVVSAFATGKDAAGNWTYSNWQPTEKGLQQICCDLHDADEVRPPQVSRQNRSATVFARANG